MENIGLDFLEQSISICKQCWRLIISLLTPIILIPFIYTSDGKEGKAAYTFVTMAIYWMLELLPLPVTALMPVLMFPLFGIISTDELSRIYMSKTLMLYTGSLIFAVAVEHCNLHKRIALRVLTFVGEGVHWAMLGCMGTTMFLSMWISNTGATVMMVPIAESVIKRLQENKTSKDKPAIDEVDKCKDNERNNDNPTTDVEQLEKKETNYGTSKAVAFVEKHKENETDNKIRANSALIVQHKERESINNMTIALGYTSEGKRESSLHSMKISSFRHRNTEFQKIRIALYLSIAYAANCGGSVTLIGTPPNTIFKKMIDEDFPLCSDITFPSWMIYNIPSSLITLMLAWTYLAFVVMKYRKSNDTENAAIRDAIRGEYEKLGKLSFQEGAIFTLFSTVIFLWIFRNPKYFPGWGSGIDSEVKVDDATPTIGMAILLFLIPAKPSLRKGPPLLDWKTAQLKIPWGVLLLIGGGAALAAGSKESGLSAYVGHQLAALHILNPDGIMVVFCIITQILTEVFSNAATANLLLPIFSQVAVSLNVNPLYFMIPAAVSCSHSFMLPVGTPPNAIVFNAAKMTMRQMVIPGMVMSMLCCIVQLTNVSTIGKLVFHLDTFPNWASVNTTTVSYLFNNQQS